MVKNYLYYEKGHIPESISIPAEDLDIRMSGLSRDKINIVYCYNQQCHLAAKAALKLAENEYPVMELEGGFHAWSDVADFEVVSS